jgi:hypothetical protein
MDMKEGDKKKLLIAGGILLVAVGLIGWYLLDTAGPRPGEPVNNGVAPAGGEATPVDPEPTGGGSRLAPTGS